MNIMRFRKNKNKKLHFENLLIANHFQKLKKEK